MAANIIKRSGEGLLKSLEDVDKELSDIVRQINNLKLMPQPVEVLDINKVSASDYPEWTLLTKKKSDGAKILYLIVDGDIKQLLVDGDSQVFI